jgi:hypothetical protein
MEPQAEPHVQNIVLETIDSPGEMLLEQYKLYVELADRNSTRRLETNQFYVTVISALLAAFAFILENAAFVELRLGLVITICVLSLLLCILWYANIRAFRLLSEQKYKVIHEMEARLPYPCFKREWDFLTQGRGTRYALFTTVERWVPFLLLIPFLVLMAYILTRQ